MMADRAYILMVDGTERPIEPANGTDFDLDELYAGIGDGCECITVHSLNDGRIMVVDDDGYSSGKATNPAASVLAYNLYQAESGIVGNVIVCADDMVR